MDDKEFNEEKNIELETLDETKEINTLKDLSRTALNQIVDEYQEEFDDGMDDADLIFKAVVDTKEEIKKEQESDPIEEEKIVQNPKLQYAKEDTLGTHRIS